MTEAVSRSWFHRFWTTRPITLILVVVLIALHAGVRLKTGPELGRSEAYRELGLLQVQQSAEHPKLTGPFDLWAGQWWRIPLGGLHHAGWWHLAIGVAAVFYLGSLLESKISPIAYVCFLAGALVATTLPRWLAAGSVPDWFVGKEPVTGITGVVFAQYGALLLLRRNDRRLTRQFGEGGILLGIVLGLGCMAFSTIAGNIADNLAHLAGFPYGLVWGFALSMRPVFRRVAVPAIVAAHLLLWPAFEGLMQPIGSGRYHWWLAERAEDPELKKQHYLAALERDPDLEYPRLAVAELELESDRPDAAWRMLVDWPSHDPDLEIPSNLGRRIWSAFSSPAERHLAWEEAEQKLADRAPEWSRHLLSPRQASAFFLEEEEPLKAWRFLMWHLRTQPPPEADSHLGEAGELAKTIWQRLESDADRRAALRILDEELNRHRRAWHLAIIPRRDLIPHYQSVGEAIWAWELLMEELRDDPGFHPAGKQIAREIWQMLPTDLRRDRARKILEDVFGPEKLSWQVELGILSEALKERYRLDQAVVLPQNELDRSKPAPIPPLNPDDPESARFGIGL